LSLPNPNRQKFGDANPNFRDAGWHLCEECNRQFRSYNKTRKYCSHACYSDARRRLAVPKPAKVIVLKPEKPKCPQCGNPVLNKKLIHCSRACLSKAIAAERRRECAVCGKAFQQIGNKTRIHCSYSCHLKSGGARRAGLASADAIMKKYGAKKDANHKEVFDVIEVFCAVKDLSAFGHGVPDGIAYIKGGWQFFDVKNPKTTYGRKGLNKRQKQWIGDWRGGPVYLLYTVEDARRFALGEFDSLKVVQSGETQEAA
jgi:hypothetical protein